MDLNADLGEGFGRWRLTDDERLLSVVTSANVACGFHAGDPATMRRVCELAAERGVTIGAQVSYRDLAGFGRRSMDVPSAELAAEVAYRIGALEVFARAAGTRVAYVKPHGALYNRVVGDEEQAAAVVDGALLAGGALPVLGLPGSRVLVGVCRTDVEGVGGAPGGAFWQAPGTQHAVGGLVGDHHGGDPGPPGPPAGPAQGGAVGHLQAVGGQVLQQGGHTPPVGEDAVSAGTRQQAPRERDHPALFGLPVVGVRAGNDENGRVSGRAVPPAQLAQRGAQSPGRGGDEVGEPDDAQRAHAASTAFREASTSV